MDAHVSAMDALSEHTISKMEDDHLADIIEEYFSAVFDGPKPPPHTIQAMSRVCKTKLVIDMIRRHRRHTTRWRIQCDSLFEA